MLRKMSDYRADFLTLNQKINDENLIYLDNAATTQKPKQVIDKIVDYYYRDNANVHRGVHTLAQRATDDFEEVRKKVKHFINANDTREIIYTKGTTEGINWIADGFGEKIVSTDDEIAISYAEHHSNLVPWQQLALRKKAKLRYIPLNKYGEVDLVEARKIINKKTKIVALNHASNVLGSINPIKEISKLVHQNGAIMVVDGAQAVPHMQVDVSEIDADFYVFSGHKMLAPTGIGVLWGKLELLEEMNPLEFGGEMIDLVEKYNSTFKRPPLKFEGGTQNIAGVVGLGAAIDYLENIGMENIQRYEQELIAYVLPKLENISGLKIYGSKNISKHTGIISFNLDNIHPHDVATALDMQGIAVRAGHHCAQVLMNFLKVPATVRLSLYFYNNKKELDKFIVAIKETKEFFKDDII